MYIAGHLGLAGSAIWRFFWNRGYRNLHGLASKELDLREPGSTRDFLMDLKPDYVIMAAAQVGGIGANETNPVSFLLDNLKIQNNVMESSHKSGVKRLVFLGSSCAYPKFAEQPIREESLLTGALEPTNEAYAIAKIAGIKLIQAYRKESGVRWISAMPSNLYGPQDTFDLDRAHVLAALVNRFTSAVHNGSQSIQLWGTGNSKREFLHSDDLASAIFTLLEKYDSPEPISIGSGIDLTIRELALRIAQIVGYQGRIEWDITKPDGAPQRLLDISKIRSLGWSPRITLEDGLRNVCKDFKAVYLSYNNKYLNLN